MAKLTKDELIAKINERLADNSELAVELMEDVTDSMEVGEVTDEYKLKYEELLEKYKQRFVSPEVAEEITTGEDVDAGEEEDKVIGTCCIKLEEDPNYKVMVEGEWLNDDYDLFFVGGYAIGRRDVRCLFARWRQDCHAAHG